MNIYEQIVDAIRQAEKIVVTAHKSPDGDSIGSSIALFEFCRTLGKNAVICHPDPAPEFLLWLPETHGILNMEQHRQEIGHAFAEADLVFSLDYNDPARLGKDMQPLLENSAARKIMIDHHLDPADFTDLAISQPECGSTCQLIYEMIEGSGNIGLMNKAIGTAIYLGIMTDSGSFRFPSVQASTHRILAHLIECGVKHYEVHENVYDTNTLDRLRLRGYACSEKLEILPEGVAVMTLSQEELNRFNYRKGDTEGLVNVGLSIQGMKAAALFTENDGQIKISFRSKGTENSVNELASDHFSGGGHANAAGGKFDGNLSDALALFRRVIGNYIKA